MQIMNIIRLINPEYPQSFALDVELGETTVELVVDGNSVTLDREGAEALERTLNNWNWDKFGRAEYAAKQATNQQ